MMDRVGELLKHITKEQRGIEIGPYHNPLASRKSGFQSIALDVFDTDELRRRAAADPNLSAEQSQRIEDVDLVGSATNIAELVEAKFSEVHFDYVVSSHNFEHLPNPIKFLHGCERVLKAGGILSMAIPDHRYCFDFYRPVTELSEWLDAFHEKRDRPTPGQVFRHGALHSLLRGQIAWSPADAEIATPAELLEISFADWQALTQSSDTDVYRDAHCWAFTPASLELMLTDLQYLGLLKFEVMEISEPNGCEFYVHLRNPSGYGYRPVRDTFYRRRASIMRRAALERHWSDNPCLPEPNDKQTEGAFGRAWKAVRAIAP